MKIFEGLVVSTGMQKTVVVEITRRTPHPLYKKLIKRSNRIKADTAGLDIVVGNRVRIVETRPMSKDKYFKVQEILTKSFEKKTRAVKPVKETKEEAK